jgi:hypothetical protein
LSITVEDKRVGATAVFDTEDAEFMEEVHGEARSAD